jgi:alpha-1,2-mannosyltransferase
MRAENLKRMSAIEPPLPVTALSSFRTSAATRPHARIQTYVLRFAAAAALVAFLSFCVLWVQWQMSSPGVSKISGDFVSFWTAGKLTLAGTAGDAYLKGPHYVLQAELTGDPDGWGYLAFFYPPFFPLLCAAFALFAYFPALCLWLLTTFAGYAAMLRGLLPRGMPERNAAWALFLGYPAVMVNAGFGQNGFLNTALLGGAAIWLDRRPTLAGICLGCLSYKPQLGVIVPFALLAARRWRCFAAACATVLALVSIATLVFGTEIWPAFITNMGEARRSWMEPENPLYHQFWITVFGAVRLHGGSLALAYGAQTAVTVAAVALIVGVLLLRRPGAQSGRALGAAIAAGVPFCSPFMLEYDLMVLAVPMAWLLGEGLRGGFRRGEIVALCAAYMAPVVFKFTLFDDSIKLGVIIAAGLLFAVVLRRMTQAETKPALRQAAHQAACSP